MGSLSREPSGNLREEGHALMLVGSGLTAQRSASIVSRGGGAPVRLPDTDSLSEPLEEGLKRPQPTYFQIVQGKEAVCLERAWRPGHLLQIGVSR